MPPRKPSATFKSDYSSVEYLSEPKTPPKRKPPKKSNPPVDSDITDFLDGLKEPVMNKAEVHDYLSAAVANYITEKNLKSGDSYGGPSRNTAA